MGPVTDAAAELAAASSDLSAAAQRLTRAAAGLDGARKTRAVMLAERAEGAAMLRGGAYKPRSSPYSWPVSTSSVARGSRSRLRTFCDLA